MNTRLLCAMTLAPLTLIACSDSSDRPSTPPAVACSGTAVTPERLFLQQVGSDRAIIKWRGNTDGGAEADAVCFGTEMDFLDEDSLTAAEVTATGHSEALLQGLTPDTTYYYSVGGAGSAQAQHSFRTAPEAGQLPADGNIRLWIVGDSGVNSQENEYQGGADLVRDGYLAWVNENGGEPADLFLMLGDNAYPEGTDVQHQIAVFDTYPDILSSTGLWPTIGNHEMGFFGASTSSDPDSFSAPQGGEPDPAPDSPMPYLNIHTLPTNGEAGGVGSGTEQYYSFDYGSVHVVSLDSQLAVRDPASREAMLQWVTDDLAANTSDWTVVIFHHPPYTKGSHDSDKILGGIDQPIFDMREQFTPVFDEYGVDLVYSGHSHIYERSFYIGGHTGLAATFDPATNAELNDAGQPASGQGDEEYTQVTRNGTDDKVVYTVAGNGGKATDVADSFPHPAHFFGGLVIGSVVVDAAESSLTARFIDDNGEVLDSFTINR
ncbi:purple acid phosphatase family protein [Pseudohalioglobus lutimaris]|nr:metallophosphoesterase family protein [Pseudohalioglobus lutimaris]